MVKIDFENQEVEVYSEQLSTRSKGAKEHFVKDALSPKIALDVKVSWKPNIPRPHGSVPMGPAGFYRSPPERHKFWVEDENGQEHFNNPIELEILKSQFTVTVHECGVDLSIQNTTLGLRAPEGGYHYRKPGECRRDPPDPDAPPPPPQNDLENYQPKPFDQPKGYNPDDIVIACIVSTYTKKSTEVIQFGANKGQIYTYFTTSQTSLDKITYPGVTEKTLAGSNLKRVFVEGNMKETETYTNNHPSQLNDPNNGKTLSENYLKWIHPNQKTLGEVLNEPNYRYRTSDTDSHDGLTDRYYEGIFHGRFGDIFKQEAWEPFVLRRAGTSIVTVEVYEYQVAYIWKLDRLDNPWKDNPPFLIPLPEPCCMECCSSNKEQNNDALLREILRRVKNTEKRLGADDYPFPVPATLIKQSDGWISSLLPPPQKTINNTQEWVRHLYLTLDELLGEFEIPIEIKDADPATPGEQPDGMKILNVAEGIGEMLGIQTVTATNSEVTVNMLMRILYELATLRQTTADSNSKTKTLVDFFGYRTTEKEEKIKLSFTAGKDKLDETLKESEHPITITIFDDLKQTYKHDVAKLLESAAIIKAVNRKKVNLNTAAADIAKNIRELAKNKAEQDKVLGKKQDDDFNKVIDDFESGFIATPGIDDGTNPYGEPYETRPKVVKLNTEPPAAPNTPST